MRKTQWCELEEAQLGEKIDQKSIEKDDEKSAKLLFFFSPAGLLCCESSFLEADAGKRVLSHNWMFVPGQFFRPNYQHVGYIAVTTLWRWGTVGALRGERDPLNGIVELTDDG